MSLKQDIERAAVRAAQPIVGWLGLAGPRDFLKPSYFLFLRLAPSKTPGHRAQSCYTSQPIPWLQARVGGGSVISAGPWDTQRGPWCPLDEDARLEMKPIPSSHNFCSQSPFVRSFCGSSLYGSRVHTAGSPAPLNSLHLRQEKKALGLIPFCCAASGKSLDVSGPRCPHEWKLTLHLC